MTNQLLIIQIAMSTVVSIYWLEYSWPIYHQEKHIFKLLILKPLHIYRHGIVLSLEMSGTPLPRSSKIFQGAPLSIATDQSSCSPATFRKLSSQKGISFNKWLFVPWGPSVMALISDPHIYKTRRRMARERRGAGSSLVSMETQF